MFLTVPLVMIWDVTHVPEIEEIFKSSRSCKLMAAVAHTSLLCGFIVHK